MILFVFEGKEREPEIFKTLEELYFNDKKERIICSFGTDIYELYNRIAVEENDEFYYKDVVAVLQEMNKNEPDNPLKEISDRSDISQVYLFFDYDIQVDNKVEKTILNSRLEKLVAYFNNETEQGKLFISYPMVEALRYMRSLPDPEFHKYTYLLSDLQNFKEKASTFSCFKNLDFACFRFYKKTKLITAKSLFRKEQLHDNWTLINMQNIKKANYICNGINEIPSSVSSISQDTILDKQLTDYYSSGMISIISSFPLFVYDYFGRVV